MTDVSGMLLNKVIESVLNLPSLYIDVGHNTYTDKIFIPVINGNN